MFEFSCLTQHHTCCDVVIAYIATSMLKWYIVQLEVQLTKLSKPNRLSGWVIALVTTFPTSVLDLLSHQTTHQFRGENFSHCRLEIKVFQVANLHYWGWFFSGFFHSLAGEIFHSGLGTRQLRLHNQRLEKSPHTEQHYSSTHGHVIEKFLWVPVSLVHLVLSRGQASS